MAIIVDPKAAGKLEPPAAARLRQQGLVREWTEYCQDKKLRLASVMVDHDNLVDVGRWGCKPRRRPFVVRSAYDLRVLSASKTFNGAMRIAQRLNAERNPVEVSK